MNINLFSIGNLQIGCNINFTKLPNYLYHSLSALVDTTPEEEDTDNKAPDVFAIGFEEIVDLNATNIVQNTQWSENAASWGKELQKVSRVNVLSFKIIL